MRAFNLRILKALVELWILLCVLPTGVLAAPAGFLDYIEGNVYYPPGTPPVEFLSVELFDTNSDLVGWGITDSVGYFQVYSINPTLAYIPEGPYLLKFDTWGSDDMANNGFYERHLIMDNFDSSHPGYTLSSFTYIFLSPITLTAATRYFKVRVTEAGPPSDVNERAAGDPVPNYELSAFTLGDPNYWLDTKTDINGEALIYVHPGVDYNYSIDGFLEGYSVEFINQIPDPGLGQTLINLQTVPGDTPITFNLKDNTGANFVVPVNDFGFVGCETFTPSNKRLRFGGDLEYLDTSTTFNVVGGMYRCYMDMVGFGTTPIQFNVQPGISQSFDVTVLPVDASVTINVLDKTTGAKITGTCFETVAFAIGSTTGSEVDHFDWDESDTGEMTLQVIDGIEYETFLSPCLGDSAFGPQPDENLQRMIAAGTTGQYVIPGALMSFVADKNSPVTIDYFLESANAMLTVTLVDDQGNAINQGWVEAAEEFDYSAGPPPEDFRWTGAPLMNGQAVLNLVAGVKYLIRAFPQPGPAGILLPPRPVEITLAENDSQQLQLQALKPNHQVGIDLSFPVSDASGTRAVAQNFVSCFGHTFDGREVFNEVNPGDPTGLLLQVEGPDDYWTIGCHVGGEENGDLRQFHGEAVYLPAAGTATGRVEIQMFDIGRYYDESCSSFTLDQSEKITLADGQTLLEIPANAFGDAGSGEVCSASGRGISFSDIAFPTSSFDIVVTVNDEEVTQPERPVNIWFAIDEDRLAELNATVGDLSVGSFNEDANTWRLDGSFTIRELDGVQYLVVPVTHFTIWGTLVNLSKALKSQFPTNLKVKRAKKKAGAKKQKVTFSWTAPSGADENQPYELEYVKLSKKNKKFEKDGGDIFDKSKMKEVTGTSWKRKLKKGKYRYRVRVKDGTNPDPKKFRVK